MVWMKHSSCPFTCGSYYVVATILTLSFLHSAAKSMEVNWEPLSASTVHGITELAIQYSMNMLAVLVAVFFAVGIDFLSFG